MIGSVETNLTTGGNVTSKNAKRPGNPEQKEKIRKFWKELIDRPDIPYDPVPRIKDV